VSKAVAALANFFSRALSMFFAYKAGRKNNEAAKKQRDIANRRDSDPDDVLDRMRDDEL
jgi:hypothetical protein